MEALRLLQRARAAGYRISLDGEEIVVRGPTHGHEHVLDELRRERGALIELLRAQTGAGTEQRWFLIDGRWYAPAAAEIYANSVPFHARGTMPRDAQEGGTRG